MTDTGERPGGRRGPGPRAAPPGRAVGMTCRTRGGAPAPGSAIGGHRPPEQLVVDRLDGPGRRRDVERLARLPARRRPGAPADRVVAATRSSASASSSGRPGGTSRPSTSSVTMSGTPPTTRGHHRQPHAHGLHQGHGEALLVRGEDEDVGAGHEPGGVGAACPGRRHVRRARPRRGRAASSGSRGPRPPRRTARGTRRARSRPRRPRARTSYPFSLRRLATVSARTSSSATPSSARTSRRSLAAPVTQRRNRARSTPWTTTRGPGRRAPAAARRAPPATRR